MAIPETIEKREYTKFTENSDGNTAVRVVITAPSPEDAPGPQTLLLDGGTTGTIEEGKPAGTLVGNLSVTGGAAPLVYSITQDLSNAFQISGDDLETSRILDFVNDGPLLNVTVRCTDNNGKFTEETFLITIIEQAGFANDKSFDFSGNGFISVNNNDYTDGANRDWGAWVCIQQDPVNIQTIYDSITSGNIAGITIKLFNTADTNDVQIRVVRSNGNQKDYRYNFPVGYNQNAFHLFHIVHRDNLLEFYLDGQLQVVDNQVFNQNTSIIFNSATEVYIGSNGGTSEFITGQIDEVYRYEKTGGLSLAEIITIYNAGIAPNHDALGITGFQNWLRADPDSEPLVTLTDSGPNPFNTTASMVGISSKTPKAFSNDWSVEFDGTNYFIGNGVPDFVNNAISMSFWIKRDSMVGTDILYGNRATVGVDNAYSIYFDANAANRLYWEMENGGALAMRIRWSLGASTIGSWTHVCITMPVNSLDATNVNLYVNGVLETVSKTIQDNDLPSIPSLNNTIAFGAGTTGGNSWMGLLDEFSIFNRELDQSEVDEIYALATVIDLQTLSYANDAYQWWRFGDLNDQGAVVNSVYGTFAAVMVNYDINLYSGDVP